MTTDLRTRMQAATTFLCADCGRRHSIATGHPITPPKQRSSEAVPAEDGLRELRALSEAATPGPWSTRRIEDAKDDWWAVDAPGDPPMLAMTGPEDAALIVAAVNYVRAALASGSASSEEPDR